MRAIWLLFSQAVTVAVALLFVLATFKPVWLERTWGMNGERATARVPSDRPVGMHSPLSMAARAAAPAIVSISARAAPTSPPTRSPHASEPWFRFFFGERTPGGSPDPSPREGLGSGVIVDPEGLVLTNHHVVAGAADIQVLLADGRETTATVVGADPETDLAVLRIPLRGLQAIILGRMDQLQVGDPVLAIGNPFNVGQTVTAGIVSAFGRSGLGVSTFENFIQTDAAINPGNSGGALVDDQGHLVGINTAIYSRSGGSMGIGFAIPVDLAKQVMQELVAKGQVTRGWIGVQPRDLDPDFAKTLQLPVTQGVLITGVLQGGPAGQAGMRPGDVLVGIEGHSLSSTAELLARVSRLAPESVIQAQVVRAGERVDLKIRIGQRPASGAP
ncbi:S1C family serine protease [Ideonella livida]|uniref:Trypsin-like serine protease n=1 Tax=Ideonella livida TaxID=2707176 RepID=A0A7C9PEA4_9BURK|nr:trypsin-like peptidase domain-containing protein [Ideonella livida]NDY89656.1 trypsin-like serine protease [Ideonella livida]